MKIDKASKYSRKRLSRSHAHSAARNDHELLANDLEHPRRSIYHSFRLNSWSPSISNGHSNVSITSKLRNKEGRRSHKRRDVYNEFYDWKSPYSPTSQSSFSSLYDSNFQNQNIGRSYDNDFRGKSVRMFGNQEIADLGSDLDWVLEPPRKLVISNSTGGNVKCRLEGDSNTPVISWIYDDGRPVREVSSPTSARI